MKWLDLSDLSEEEKAILLAGLDAKDYRLNANEKKVFITIDKEKK